ncbi:MAG: LamG-like jellyroll fold domain-containing protein [archaeon]
MSFMMLIFATSFVVIEKKSVDIGNDQTEKEVIALANIIKTEIELAHTVHDGYTKTFWIPDYINGEDFEMTLDGTDITINYKDRSYYSFVEINETNMTGFLVKGTNTIMKQNSKVFLNNYTAPYFPADIKIITPPQGSTLEAGTTATWIEIETNYKSLCKYNLSDPDFTFSDSGITFSTTGSYNHSFYLTGLVDGQIARLYYKCDNYEGDVSRESTLHTFGIGTIPLSVVLESEIRMNFTTEFLTIRMDGYGGSVNNITDWRLDGASIAVLNMPFDTNSSTSVKDYTTYPKIGIIGDMGVETAKPIWTPNGKVGGAYEFDGIQQIIGIADDVNINLVNTNKRTYNIWFKADDTTNRRVIYKEGGSSNGFVIYIYNSNIYSGFWSTGMSANDTLGTGFSDTQNWHHLLFSFDSINGVQKLYLDGVEKDASSETGQINSHSGDINIGYSDTTAKYHDGDKGAGNYFDGIIDELMIYKRVFSDEQIQEIYAAGLAGKSVQKIVSQETVIDDVWSVEVNGNHGQGGDIDTVLSNTLIIVDTPPLVVMLSTASGNDLTLDDLNLYLIGLTSSVTNITDWRINGTSIAVLNMPFDTESTTIVKDYSTYANNGLVSGVSWTSNGQIGGAHNFLGSQSYISVPDSQSLHLSDMTIELWFNADEWSTTSASGLIAKRNSYATLDWELYYNHISNRIMFMMQNSTAYKALFWSANINPASGGFHHIAVTKSGNNYHIFYDGDWKQTETSSGNWDDSDNIVIGALEANEIGGFNGIIDNIKVYNRALSREQILASYNAGLTGHSAETMSKNETAKGDNWTVAITPSYGAGDGIMQTSNGLTILNSPPGQPDINVVPSPANVSDTLVASSGGSEDPDQDTLTYLYEFYNVDDNTYQSYSTNNLYLVTTNDKHDIIRVRVIANDGTVNSTYNEQAVSIANSKPVWTQVIRDMSKSEDAALSVVDWNLAAINNGQATDEDGDTLTFSVISENTNQVDCILSGINNVKLDINLYPNWFGTAYCTIRSDDSNGGTAEDEFKITVSAVNDAPVWTEQIRNMSITEDDPITVVDSSLAAANNGYATDPDADPLTFSVQSETTGEVDCTITGNKLEILPAPNWYGTAYCTIRVNDGSLTADEEFTITVSKENDPPVWASEITANVNEDSGLQQIDSDLSASGNGWATDTDGDTLTFSVVSNTPNKVTCLVSGTNNKILSVQPAANWNGNDATCMVTANDGKGGTAEEPFTIIVNPVNDAPEWTGLIPDRTINEDSETNTINDDLTIVGEGYATDIDGDTLTFSVAAETTSKVNCEIVNNKITLTPATNFAGTTTCTIRTNDGKGGTKDDTFTITVNQLFDDPTGIHYTNFANSWDGWIDGGTNCYRHNEANRCGSGYIIELVGGTSTSYTQQSFDLSGYGSVQYDFSVQTRGYTAANECFALMVDGVAKKTFGDNTCDQETTDWTWRDNDDGITDTWECGVDITCDSSVTIKMAVATGVTGYMYLDCINITGYK